MTFCIKIISTGCIPEEHGASVNKEVFIALCIMFDLLFFYRQSLFLLQVMFNSFVFSFNTLNSESTQV